MRMESPVAGGLEKALLLIQTRPVYRNPTLGGAAMASPLRNTRKKVKFLTGRGGNAMSIRGAARICVTAAMLLAAQGAASAGEIVSDYTDLDPEGGCVWDSLDHLSESEKEEMLGNSAVCKGLPGYPVHFSEYDLRQYVAFGEVDEEDRVPGGFEEFNHTGDKIEWRIEDGTPVAAILRWFIENPDPNTGETDKALEGQVLVVSSVAEPGDGRGSCPVAFVDARENANANELARELADRLAKDFVCGKDKPAWHGKRGPHSGEPVERVE
jgi:hypothetical protein